MKPPSPKYPAKISMVWTLFAILSFLLILVIFLIGAVIYYRDYTNVNFHKTQRRREYIGEQKRLIRIEVGKVVDYIRFVQSKIDQRLKKSIKDRACEAHVIASNLYQEHKDSKSEEEVGKIILDALRPIRYNDGRGYYFAKSFDGVEILFPERPEWEGENLIDRKDSRGAFIVRDMIETVKREVLDWIEKIKFGKDGYIFVLSKEGEFLVNRSDPLSIGKPQWELNDPDVFKLIQMARLTAEKPKGGFIYYQWIKPEIDIAAPKMSFVKLIPEWDWIIGAGIYTDEIDSEIAAMEESLRWNARSNFTILGVVFIIILLGILLFYYHISRYYQKQLDVILLFLSKESSGGNFIDADKIVFQELRI